VPGLGASDGAGNACILPFARSAAWTESWRSLAEASAAAERRKASGPRQGPLPTPVRGRTMDGAPIGAPLPSLFLVVVLRQNSDAMRRENEFVFTSPRRAGRA
jgi:hypothetical protein